MALKALRPDLGRMQKEVRNWSINRLGPLVVSRARPTATRALSVRGKSKCLRAPHSPIFALNRPVMPSCQIRGLMNCISSTSRGRSVSSGIGAVSWPSGSHCTFSSLTPVQVHPATAGGLYTPWSSRPRPGMPFRIRTDACRRSFVPWHRILVDLPVVGSVSQY